VYGWEVVELTHVQNNTRVSKWLWYAEDGCERQVPDYLSDDTAALGLLEKLAEDGRIGIVELTRFTVYDGSRRWRCKAYIKGFRCVDGWGLTLPRAIVLAVDAVLMEEAKEAAK